MNVGQVFLVLSLVATAMSIDCVQNYASSSVVTWHATEAVGQYFAGSRITYNQFIGAALTRADSNPISGTAYIIPGQSTNVSAAIWSSPFSSSTNLVFANATVPLVYGGPYTLVWVRDATGNDTDLNQAGDWISNSVGLYSATFTDPDFAGQFCFNFLPNNNIPSHSVRGIGAFSANYSQVNAQQGVRINQGTNGINLIIYVNDTDLAPANSTGIINFTATVNTISSASGSGYGYLYLSSSETPYVTVNENSNFLISLSGTLANIQACVARISVRWTPLEIMTFRVTINVNDNGNYGGCGGSYPCPLWTQSRTEFRTSVTGT